MRSGSSCSEDVTVPFSLSFFNALRKFGLIIFPYARRTDVDRTLTFFFFSCTSSSGESFVVHPLLPPLTLCLWLQFCAGFLLQSPVNCWRKSRH